MSTNRVILTADREAGFLFTGRWDPNRLPVAGAPGTRDVHGWTAATVHGVAPGGPEPRKIVDGVLVVRRWNPHAQGLIINAGPALLRVGYLIQRDGYLERVGPVTDYLAPMMAKEIGGGAKVLWVVGLA